MTVIAASVIHRPRKVRRCEGFRHEGSQPMEAPHVRLYGRASDADIPFLVYVCLRCARRISDGEVGDARPPKLRKVTAALATYAAERVARLNHQKGRKPRRRSERGAACRNGQ